MKHRITALLLAGVLLLSCTACSGQEDTPETEIPTVENNEGTEVQITLSDEGVTSTDETAVHTGDEIIYYKDGTDETYGEGEEHEKHSAEEAAQHTVVTITQPGTYRVTGKLSRGQIFVDLGEDAKRDPNAVVALILDNVDITCTVAPAIFFYRVFECNTEWVAYDEGEVEDYQASPVADTTAAGANVILAAGSENNVNGSHVARIYKEGTTKKLHKYDGAFYSKMSMNIYGDNGDDSGVLNVTADNEGMNSEMHLTVHGGNIYINSQDDGINTNEDNVSVTTINGGYLMVEAGRGAEGDGIDSNGYLTINGGTICTMSNERTPDGGIDADGAITINGGTLYAFGTRNDAADKESAQPYMELSFASTLPKDSVVEIKNEAGTVLWGATTFQSCQSITLTTPELALDTVYHVYVNDVLQCYSGNSFGMMGGGNRGQGGTMGGQRPDGMERPEGFDPSQMQHPEGDRSQMPEGAEWPKDFDLSQIKLPEGLDLSQIQLPEGFDLSQILPEGFDLSQLQLPEGFDLSQIKLPEGFDLSQILPEGFDLSQLQLPEDFDFSQMGQRPDGMGGGRGPGGMMNGQNGGSADGETDFILTETVKSFSGVCDSAQSGKTAVTFRVEGQLGAGSITAITCSDESLALDQIQVTVTDDPSEDYAESCLLSDGMDAVNNLLPEDAGNYLLTVAVISGNATHTGASQVRFTVEATEATEE